MTTANKMYIFTFILKSFYWSGASNEYNVLRTDYFRIKNRNISFETSLNDKCYSVCDSVYLSRQQNQINSEVDIKSHPKKIVDEEGMWTSAATLFRSPNLLFFHFVQLIKSVQNRQYGGTNAANGNISVNSNTHVIGFRLLIFSWLFSFGEASSLFNWTKNKFYALLFINVTCFFAVLTKRLVLNKGNWS